MGDLKDGYLLMGDICNSWYEQNKAHFWTGVSMAGSALTAIASANDTARVFRKCRKEYGCDPKELPVKERLKLYAANYITTAGCLGTSIFGAVKSDRESTKIIAERTGLYLATRKSYDLLKKNLKEVVGEKKAQQVQDKAAEEKIERVVTPERVADAPVFGRGDQLFMDGYTEELLWSNIDFLRRCEMEMKEMMRELAPRNHEYDYYDNEVGVHYYEWLSKVGFPREKWNTKERKHVGWNKGFRKDGEDDDPISFYTVAKEYEPGKSCLVIEWEKDPSDMRLGRLIKSSGL